MAEEFSHSFGTYRRRVVGFDPRAAPAILTPEILAPEILAGSATARTGRTAHAMGRVGIPIQRVNSGSTSPFIKTDSEPIDEPRFISVSYSTTAMFPTEQPAPIFR